MKVTIGLEIHIHLLTKTKLFCSCSTEYENKEPNVNVCPICLGLPGSKPKLNKKAFEDAIKVALALNCKIPSLTFFSRKNYFYPDLPKNFQITQYEFPIGRNGYLEVDNKKIKIRRVHLEEDPGKLIHVGGSIIDARYVLIDYNRSGIPLLEIVTEPEFDNTKQVRRFLEKLRIVLEYLKVFDASRESAIRVDANISLKGGERIEIKNITGFANVEKALNFEIIRQENLLRMGMKIERETRFFDESSKTTYSIRKKELEEDYGYTFEPDLPIFEINKKLLHKIENELPELPDKRVERFVSQYKIPRNFAKVIVYTGRDLADFFEKCTDIYRNYKYLARWIVVDLLKCLNWNNLRISESNVTPENFVKLLKLIDKKIVTERLAKEIIKEVVATGKDPEEIMRERSLSLLNEEELVEIVRDVVRRNNQAVEDYKAGNEKALHFLIGSVVKKTKARVDPIIVKKIVLEIIKRKN
jgi:aspartyl-tRNA(Asn)/glutamyl-tRNA(Gln) amidotransferase subunit B